MERLFIFCLAISACFATSGCATQAYTGMLTDSSRDERLVEFREAVRIGDRVAVQYALGDGLRHQGKSANNKVRSGSIQLSQWSADLDCEIQRLDNDFSTLRSQGTRIKTIPFPYAMAQAGLPEAKDKFRDTDLPIAVYYSSRSFYIVRRDPEDSNGIPGTACENIARGDYTPAWEIFAGAPLYPGFIAVDIVTAPFQLFVYAVMSHSWPS